MKAIVAEIDKKHMIVITDKGDFIKVKRQMSAGIGDEIEVKPQKLYPAYKRLAGIAACFMACIFLSTGVYAYYTPYSYVSVDINPSISLSLNRFEKVIAVAPITEDAVGLINDTKGIKNQNIDKALTTIIKSASEKGYIDAEEENQVVVVVSAKNQQEEEKLVKEVNAAAAKELAKVNKSSEVMVEKASIKSHKEALSNKVSPGKEVLAGKLREVEPGLKDEEIRKMSVKEAAKRINEKRKAAAEQDKNSRDEGRNKDKGDKNSKPAEKRDDKDEKRWKDNDKKNSDKKNSDNRKPSAAADKKDAPGVGSDKNKKDKDREKDDEDDDKERNTDKSKDRDKNIDQDKNNGKDRNEADKNKKPGDNGRNDQKKTKDDDKDNKYKDKENDNKRDGKKWQ